MAAPFRDGPEYLTNSAANVYNNSNTNVYTLIQHIHLCNTDTAGHQVTLYVGATGGSAAGTEEAKLYNVPANDVRDIYYPAGLKMLSTDFLTGLADTTNKVTITTMGVTEAL